jgi:predicted ATPase/class 3 adenylate cyclase
MVSDLPTGTVTFLFTDIEGSTRLLQELGDGYRAVQDRHAGLIRAAIGARHGHEVRTEGDSFLITFARAPDAIQAAVDIQRAMAREAWPHGELVRVRIGMHTGEGTPGGGDYIGIDVNRAARIAAAGHGGQILLSDATRGLVERTLPEGVTVRSLGRHRLKDIEGSQRLHDLVIEGLPAEFPEIRTLSGGPTNMAPERTSFVGRSEDLSRIAELLAETRLVTLTGPGGTGKTRLALKAGKQALDRFRDGVFLVDLGPVVDPELVPSAIASALGVREDPGRALLDSVVDQLRDAELLLILDNFEQVVEGTPVVDRLLDAAPGLRILVTSRVPLRLAGEREYHVRPLALPIAAEVHDLTALGACEAVMLFVERAVAVQPGFRLTEETSTPVAAITARLDGLPLAIELAANRVKVLAPGELLERLERRLPLLSGGARDVPERQRTLRATIEWSHDLLEPEVQRLFARLAVFAGGWTLPAAEAVCGPGLDIEALDGLTTLVDHSLVRRGSRAPARFRMLETVREFAAERLAESGEEDEIRRGHASNVVATVEAAEPDLLKDPALLDRLEGEHDNVRGALRWAIDHGDAESGLRIAGALWRFWQVRNHLVEGRSWTEAVLALPAASSPTAARAKALGALGSLAYYLQDRPAVRAAYEESLAISRELGDERGEANGAYNLAFALMVDQEMEGAEMLLRRAADLHRALGQSVQMAHANAALGLTLILGEGDLDAAERLVEGAHRTFEEAGEWWGIALTTGQMAGLALRRGELAAAREKTMRSLEAAEAMGAQGWTAVAMRGLAVVAIRQGQLERGMRLAGVADRLEELAGGEAPPALVGLEDPRELVGETLPPDRIDALLEEGRGMSLDEAFSYAREPS